MITDEKALSDLVKQLEDAWNAADPVAFAAAFSEDAIFIHIFGGQIDGRKAIEEGHRMIFEGIYRGSRNRYTVKSIRFLRPDVAVVLVEAQLQFQGGDVQARPTMIAVKQEGEWVLTVFQNTRISPLPGPKS